MSDVFDYLNWRGDLTLAQSPFCEVDGMILARLSYLPFELFASGAEPVTVKQAASRLLEVPDIAQKVLLKDDVRLMQALMESERFGDMQLSFYENRTDLETQTQFSAITVRMQEGLWYIAYRGTDSTFVGWKEDFNMSFSCPVPAQELAVRYLERVAAHTEGSLITGGHSKGGNLAVYAAAFCAVGVQQRIEAVYNYDGPGFDAQVIAQDGYQHICDRVTTFIPQSSIVGQLLEHEEKYIIVHSARPINVMQHDVYSWEVERNRFVQLESVTNDSRFIDQTLKAWVASMSTEQREKFFDAVYTVLTQTNLHSFRELDDNLLVSAMSVMRSYKNLDEETRAAVTATLRALYQSAKDTWTRRSEGDNGPKEVK